MMKLLAVMVVDELQLFSCFSFLKATISNENNFLELIINDVMCVCVLLFVISLFLIIKTFK